jgi:hypothetical protein
MMTSRFLPPPECRIVKDDARGANSGWRLTYFGLPKLPILRCVGFAMYRDLRFGEPGYHKRFLGFYCATLAPSQRKSSSLTDDEINTLLAGLIIPP